MKFLNSVIFLAVFSIFLLSCSESKKSDEKSVETKSVSTIKLVNAPQSPEYENAELTLDKYCVKWTDSTMTPDFSFQVFNYELGVQTEGSETRGIANSGKGQHIHMILNNDPYSAHYTPEFTKELDKRNYVALAFLSRSYHESVKNENAYVLTTFPIDTLGDSQVDFDQTAQHLFYSRPKGTYKGADTKNILLDFYLINTTISAEGNKVRANINGQEFIIDEWVPYYIQGLPLGEVTIKLELIDAEGNGVPGPYNEVERKVMLTE